MLLKFEDKIFRVLESKENQLLVINCTQKSMPVWINKAALAKHPVIMIHQSPFDSLKISVDSVCTVRKLREGSLMREMSSWVAE